MQTKNIVRRSWFSVFAFVTYLIARWVWGIYEGQMAGRITASQLNDSVQPAFNAALMSAVPTAMFWIFILVMLITWVPVLLTVRKKVTPTLILSLLAFLPVVTLSSCGDAKTLDPVEIKPNETAWVVPLEGEAGGGQQKFNSVEFLESKKVASKRVMVDKVKRSTGYMPGSYEWLPAARVIRVDRTLCTGEWTDGDKSGTSNKKEGILVVTKDSIRLVVGLTVTVSIEETDASKYLYYHGERPLADVMNTNLRSYAVAELTDSFAKMTLSEAQVSGPKIYAELSQKAKEEFIKVGITIHYLGNAEGVQYDDPKIQAAINEVFLAEQSQKTAVQDQIAQKTRNETLVLKAKAQADAAEMLFKAQEASRFQNELQVSLNQSQAALEMAQKWNGALPSSILPSNSPLLLNLGAGTGTTPAK